MRYAEACRELDVLPNSSSADIKRAYRRLVRQHHPDLNGGTPEAAARFQRIQAAYDLLMKERPAVQSAPRRGTPVSWPGRRVPLKSPVRGQDVTGTLRVSLPEVFTGTTADITFEDLEPCERCGATGAEPGSSWIPCPPCQGMPSPKCEWCAGEGQVPAEACRECEGAGVDEASRTVRVAVPRSSRDGQTLRVKDKGGWGLKGRGEIRLDLTVDPHPSLRRNGDDLEMDLPISVLQAVLGGEAEVQGMDETPFRIAITPGSSSGKRMRLAGRGLYRGRTGEERGDLYAVLSVQVPDKLTERQRHLYQRLLEEEAAPGESPGSES